ncbi:RND family transporter [Oceanicoccus sp. KOV_DT_Chl]|uniref:efflux RND transporter permease subunit n=1 Tax=Oceanicoccus sp. KOV_DT_Chl TaxID=1904639 RepID=UPI000C7A5961|nr:MMPL family transporter [Oceanicoccus sp. KOV_DT_Chl]
MKNRFFAAYEAIILRRPLITLLISLLIIGWLSTHIPSFKLDASADSLVLEGDQALKYYREISKRYASEDFLLVTYRPQQDLLADDSLATLDKLRQELAALPGVSSVVTILDVPLLESPKVTLDEVAGGDGLRSLRTPGIDKELVLAELTHSPIYENLLTSADGQTTALQVNLQRDEKYQALLVRRESLREREAQKLLSNVEQAQLVEVEQQFREYAASVNQKQSQLVDAVRGILIPYREDAQVFLGGVPMIAADMISFVKSDLVVFGTGIIVFIIITLSIIFRRPTWVLLPLVTCLLSAAFMLGLITWLDWRMTVISSNFVALLLIITLSITIHLVVRYREMVAGFPELSQRELVTQTAFFMIKPCIYTALTTMVAFASLVISGIRPVIDFGWMMTVGVTAALVISFIILPCTLMLLKKPKGLVKVSDETPATLQFAALTERHGSLILWTAGLLTVISIVGVTRLEVENRFIDYFHESTEIYQGMEIIDAQLGGTIPLEIILDAVPDDFVAAVPEVANTEQAQANAEEFDAIFSEDISDDFSADTATKSADDEFFTDEFAEDFSDDFSSDDADSEEPSYWFNRSGLSRIEQVHDYVDSLDETGKVMSLATSYKVLRGLTSGIDDIQLTLIQRSLPADINNILIDPYLNEEIDQARITVRVKETSHTLRRADLLKQVQGHLVDELGFQPEQVHLTGMLVLYNNMLQSLYRSQILTIGAVFIAIVLMFVVLFRSLSMALIAIAPNLLAAGLVLGGMGLAGIPLDIMTVTIAAISVGIAVDNTIHYVHRFRTEFPLDHNYLATMYRCHRSIGKAMFYTSITVIIGFSILALSNFNPSIYFGLLTGTAMFAALIGSLLLLPQLLITFKPLGPNQPLANDKG